MGLNKTLTTYLARVANDEFVLAINPEGPEILKMERDVLLISCAPGSGEVKPLVGVDGFFTCPKKRQPAYLAHAPPWANPALSFKTRVSLGAAWLHIPPALKTPISNVFMHFKVNAIANEYVLLSTFKAISDFAFKVKNKRFRGDLWIYLVAWHTILGVFGQATSDNEAIAADLAAFMTPKDHGADWDAKYRAEVATTIFNITQHPHTDAYLPTFDQFLMDRKAWATAGSHSGALDGIRTPYRKTKWAAAMLLSDDQLRQMAWTNDVRKYICKAFVKNEKVYRRVARLVINASFPIMIHLAYIMHLFKVISETSSIASANNKTKMWETILSYKDLDSRDIEQFDHQQRKQNVLDGVSEAVLRIMTLLPGMAEEVFRSHNQFLHIANNTQVALTLPKNATSPKLYVILDWLNGMLSGLPITSEFNSIFNLTMNTILTREVGAPLNLTPYTMGDDFIAGVTKYGDSVAIWKQYLVRNFSIKPSGSQLGHWGEFLRYVPDTKTQTVRGYPIRAVGALCWTQDPSQLPNTKGDQLSKVSTLYSCLSSRGMDHRQCEKSAVRESSNITGWNTHQAGQWLHTSGALGGAAISPLTDQLLEYAISYDQRSPAQSLVPSADVVARVPPTELQRFLAPLLIFKKRDGYNVSDMIIPPPSTVDFKVRGVARRGIRAELTPQYRPELCASVFFQPRLNVLIQEHKWEEIATLLTPQSAATYDQLRSCASRRVIMSWLMLRVKPSPPKTCLNMELMSDLTTDLAKRAFGYALAFNKHIDYNYLLALMADCEFTAQNMVGGQIAWTW